MRYIRFLLKLLLLISMTALIDGPVLNVYFFIFVSSY